MRLLPVFASKVTHSYKIELKKTWKFLTQSISLTVDVSLTWVQQKLPSYYDGSYSLQEKSNNRRLLNLWL